MRSSRFLVAGVVGLLFVASVARAEQPTVPGSDTAPWHVSTVARLNSTEHGVTAAADAAAQKYLHIELPVQYARRCREETQFPRRQRARR